MHDVLKLIKDKKWPPTDIPAIYIDGFDHWTFSENIKRIDDTLKKIIKDCVQKKCLDVGFGNPILLQREVNLFLETTGLYIKSEKARTAGCRTAKILEGNCYQMPFQSEVFDILSAYALLHIIPDIPSFFEEAYRVLRKGGVLYTDGDRNIFLVKLIQLFNIIRYFITGKKALLGYWRNIFKENELYHKQGIDYKQLKKLLYNIGFKKVVITPWFSLKPEYNNKIIYRLIINLLSFFRIHFLHTHIQIVAYK